MKADYEVSCNATEAPLIRALIVTAAPTRRPKGPAVYLVDDDTAVLNALQFSLDIDGYNVTGCCSATAFLSAFEDRGGSCVVVDYHLPDMTGLDLSMTLR